MANARDGQEKWELRLGVAHAMVWVGLALGTVVGAYFVGFFSGRYVGFDTARSGMVSDVAKLAIQEDLFEKKSELGSSEIYSRLDGSAMNDVGRQDIAGTRGGSNAVDKGTKQAEEPSAASKFAQAVKDAPHTVESVATPKGKSEGAIAAAEIDSLFNESLEKEDTTLSKGVPLGRASAAGELDKSDTIQKGIRVLGEVEHSLAAVDSTAIDEVDDSSLSAILDERLAMARAASNEAASVAVTPLASVPNNKLPAAQLPKTEAAVKPTKLTGLEATPAPKPAKIVEASKGQEARPLNEGTSQTTAGSAGMVKQVLPAGYFAQVAAPKRLGEAQDIARRLKGSGFPVVIETAHIRGEDYFRVLVGPEETKIQADRLVEQLKRESYLGGGAFLRRVK